MLLGDSPPLFFAALLLLTILMTPACKGNNEDDDDDVTDHRSDEKGNASKNISPAHLHKSPAPTARNSIANLDPSTFKGRYSSRTTEEQLFHYLFGHRNETFRKYVRPVVDHETSLKVRLGICIMTIDDILEKDQTLVTTGCIKMRWFNEILTWNPHHFENLTWIALPSSEIWLPDIALVNSPEPFLVTRQPSTVELWFNGEVGYYPSGRFVTRCTITLTYFPFDAQLCSLDFEVWAFPVEKTEIQVWPTEPIDLAAFVTNHQWVLNGIGVETSIIGYDSLNFSTIHFYMSFQRRSLYDIVFSIYPCLLMTALQVVAHTMPVEYEGRMALLTALFVGSSVILSSVSSSMPRSSEGVSVFQAYLLLYSGSLLISISETAFYLHVYRRVPFSKKPTAIALLSSFLTTFGSDAEESDDAGTESDNENSNDDNNKESTSQRRSKVPAFKPKICARKRNRRNSVDEQDGSDCDIGSGARTSRAQRAGDDFELVVPKVPSFDTATVTTNLTTGPEPPFDLKITLTQSDGQQQHQQLASTSSAEAPSFFLSSGGGQLETSENNYDEDQRFRHLMPLRATRSATESYLRRHSNGARRQTLAKIKMPKRQLGNKRSNPKQRWRREWLLYAASFDKCCFYLMSAGYVIAPIVLFVILPNTQDLPGREKITTFYAN